MDIKIIGILKEGKTIYRFGRKNDRLYLSHTIFMEGVGDWFIMDSTFTKGSSQIQAHIRKYQNLINRDIKLRQILDEQH